MASHPPSADVATILCTLKVHAQDLPTRCETAAALAVVCKAEGFTIFIMGAQQSSIPMGSSAQNPQTQNTAQMQEIIEAEQASDESDSHPWPLWRKYNKGRHEVHSIPCTVPFEFTGQDSMVNSPTLKSSVEHLPKDVLNTFTPRNHPPQLLLMTTPTFDFNEHFTLKPGASLIPLAASVPPHTVLDSMVGVNFQAHLLWM
ncbi:hypothetical protein F5148DRAFT_1151894 [Russula earlei]|uniref:Uncharacterized protein n=1 Tax=Russula earlei TaxID=71964 RepID=A0ACC0TYQ8_9AGAM|nr:hypothetical protein F5148DRAFT_1151894 [Russula earlei]